VSTISDKIRDKLFSFSGRNLTYSPIFELVRKLTSEKVHGRRVLEVGAVPNSFSFDIARKGGIVSGIGSCEESLKKMQDEARANMLKHACFRVYDGSTLPFNNGTFDLVVCNLVSSEKDDEAFLAESCRVLKPQGEVIFIEFVKPSNYNNNSSSDEHFRLFSLNNIPSDVREKYFNNSKTWHFHLTTAFSDLFENTILQKPLYRLFRLFDKVLLFAVPALKKFCKVQVTVLAAPVISPVHNKKVAIHDSVMVSPILAN